MRPTLRAPIRSAMKLAPITGAVKFTVAIFAAIRSGKTPADIFQGGATSLSNLGRRRVDEFAAIISPPQSSMLAIGRVAERPAAFEGRICLRQTVHLTLSVDHRVSDGAEAAQFMQALARYLEEPLRMLV